MTTTLGREVNVRDGFKIYGGSVQKPRRRSYRKAAVVVTITVDPQVWAVAMATADGETGRIEVVSATTVVVHNSTAARRSRKQA